MVRPSNPSADPALDAAALLRRMGFFTLFVVMPVAAQVARRATVLLAPIAVVLLIIASAIDRRQRPFPGGMMRMLGAPAFLAGMLVILWAALSLVWTPFPGSAAERLANLVVTIVLTLAAYFSLPDRMRSANLYLLPLGVGAAAMVAILIGLFGDVVMQDDGDSDSALERGSVLLALLVWPAIAWLRSRNRNTESLTIAVIVGGALLLAPDSAALLGLVVGALAFALTNYRQSIGVRITALAAAGLIAAAPLLPFLLRPGAALLFGSNGSGVKSLAVWEKIVTSEPLRLVTGHGFESALRGRFAGLLPMNAPTTILFELWYELGIVGALAVAFTIYATTRSTVRQSIVAPGAVAGFAAAFALGCAGVGTTVIWWLTSLAVTILAFVTIERGQFRSRRPQASMLTRSNSGS